MIAALSCSQKTMTGPAQYPGISVGVPNLTRGLMRLGIDDNKRSQIGNDIKAGRSHHIAEISISDEQVF
jgi:hypothetical protein